MGNKFSGVAKNNWRGAPPDLASASLKSKLAALDAEIEPDTAVITWAKRQDQSADIARRLGATFYGVQYLFFGSNPRVLVPFRYLLQTLKTWQIFLRHKPAVVYVTNPPIFAAINVFLYSFIFNAKYIIDTHSPALYSRKWKWTVPCLRLLSRFTLVNIVDQERFKLLFESWGAKAIVLSKPLRSYPLTDMLHGLPDSFPITVVNTFAPDEPLEPILYAAKHLPNVQFYILGDTRLADRNLLTTAPNNVTFTGYLPHDKYWEQLRSSRAVMALTTYSYSLLAGATDGMSVRKPLILSRQTALVDYFPKGVIFIDNTGQGIMDGIQQLQQQEEHLCQQINELLDEKRQTWETSFQELQSIIGESRREASPLKT